MTLLVPPLRLRDPLFQLLRPFVSALRTGFHSYERLFFGVERSEITHPTVQGQTGEPMPISQGYLRIYLFSTPRQPSMIPMATSEL